MKPRNSLLSRCTRWGGLAIAAVAVTLTLALQPYDRVYAAQAAAEVTGKVLTIGMVSDKPKKHVRYLQPMVDYVVSQMADLGFTRGRVRLARNNARLVDLLRSGDVDWATETPFSAAEFHERAQAEYLVRRWKKGVAEYHSVIVVRKNSPIQSLEDLAGAKIAFEDPGSTSGFFVPASDLIDRGHELMSLRSPRDAVPNDRIGFAFSRQEVNTANWVIRGMVDAGALSNRDWEHRDLMGIDLKGQMRIIHRSRSFPRAVEVVRRDLDPATKARLKSVLLAAHENPAGLSALKSYQKTARFDELNSDMLGALRDAGRLRRVIAQRLD